LGLHCTLLQQIAISSGRTDKNNGFHQAFTISVNIIYHCPYDHGERRQASAAKREVYSFGPVVKPAVDVRHIRITGIQRSALNYGRLPSIKPIFASEANRIILSSFICVLANLGLRAILSRNDWVTLHLQNREMNA
jgi:hypothetical protein